MDGLTTFVSTTQAISYVFSVAKGLAELRNALKHGRTFVDNERATVVRLQEIISKLRPKDEIAADASFKSLLSSINSTVEVLLALFQQQKLRQIVVLLIIRRAEVNESFASLERQKTTLLLHLTAQNSAGTASLSGGTLFNSGSLSQSTQALKMSTHSSSPSTDSLNRSPTSSEASISIIEEKIPVPDPKSQARVRKVRGLGRSEASDQRAVTYSSVAEHNALMGVQHSKPQELACYQPDGSSHGKEERSFWHRVRRFRVTKIKATRDSDLVLYRPDPPIAADVTYKEIESTKGSRVHVGVDCNFQLEARTYSKMPPKK